MTVSNTQLTQRYYDVVQHIHSTAQQYNREPPTLIAVSKKHSASKIAALVALEHYDFGENYLQEALDKMAELSNSCSHHDKIIWHYIGGIQSNKTKDIAAHFTWVHSVDRLKIAKRLNDQRPEQLPALNVCLQINIDNEDSKFGCQPADLPALIAQVSQLPRLNLRGLMIIPNKDSNDAFERTAQLFEEMRQHHQHPECWDSLSMGMSADIAQAIAAGATMVRIGTAVFGARPS